MKSTLKNHGTVGDSQSPMREPTGTSSSVTSPSLTPLRAMGLLSSLYGSISTYCGSDNVSPMKLRALLFIASSDLPYGVREIGHHLDISKASIQRALAELGEGRKAGDELFVGLGLIEKRTDPHNFTRDLHYLTAKGRMVVDEVTTKLNAGFQRGAR